MSPGLERLLQARVQLIEIYSPLGRRIAQLFHDRFAVVVRGPKLARSGRVRNGLRKLGSHDHKNRRPRSRIRLTARNFFSAEAGTDEPAEQAANDARSLTERAKRRSVTEGDRPGAGRVHSSR
ncbi:hypothetical protein GCM10010232_38420 [Streptomyces amakusaensis]